MQPLMGVLNSALHTNQWPASMQLVQGIDLEQGTVKQAYQWMHAQGSSASVKAI